MIYLPVIGAFLEAAGMIIEKKILRNKKMNFRNYTAYEFAAVVIMMIPMMFFVWHIQAEAFILKNILILTFVIIISVIANLLIFYSLKRESVSEFEPIWIMQPLFVILLAFIFFRAERDIISLVLALIASLTLILTHVKKHHLKFDKYILATLLGSFLFAVELIASKPILQYYNPFTFYFIRCLFIFIICFLLYKPNGRDLNTKITLMTLAIGLMWAFYRGIMYYGFENLGIIHTTILFCLSPVLIFFFATIFLKEKPTLRNIISTAIIVICVIASILIKN